ncbi:dodecin family protein [Miltoncostaea oceani]|jgi:flavin-binding protein dodecin|uniref:dodecin family protein n=1 Tax=Miltoncostaea oceani TaxID=2843216 RepID=UPI001C3D877C|nr:dodecin family protein [Miltoncostaea oceani]
MDTAFKVVRVVGESAGSIEDAAKVALKTSADRVHGLTWIQIADIRANVNEDGEVDRWQVTVDISFKVDGQKD